MSGTPPTTLNEMLEDYLLRTDLRTSTAKWYRSIIKVFCIWYGAADVPADKITTEVVNRFLREKQEEGKSSYYRKGLRSALRSIGGEELLGRGLRKVKLEPMSVRSWTADEIGSLIKACGVLPIDWQPYFRKIIAVAYHTGLSQIDLHRLTPEHIDKQGVVRIRRSKTRQDVICQMPLELLKQLPQVKGRYFPERASGEMFRRHFRRVVKAAGLKGSFKKIRSSSGTAAELLNGKGHEHLANTRKIFEQHYMDRHRIERVPTALTLPTITSW